MPIPLLPGRLAGPPTRPPRARLLAEMFDNADDRLVLRGEMPLEALALVEHRRDVPVRLVGPVIAFPPEDVLPDHDHDHEDQAGEG